MSNRIDKVLYITSRFPALSMTFVANEMSAIQANGVHVDVAALWKSLPNHRGHPNELQFIERVKNTPINLTTCAAALLALLTNLNTLLVVFQLLPGHLKSPWLFAKLLAAIPKGVSLGKYAKKQRYNLIHAHFLTTPTTVALIASRYSGIPYTCTAHAFDITSSNPRIVNGSILLKYKFASSMITISKYNEADIRKRWPSIGGKKLHVIYNGIDTNNYRPITPKETLTKKPTKVVCISNLNAKKGHIYLVKAIKTLLDANVDITLDLFGTGPMQADLEYYVSSENISDCIKLHGAVNQSDTAGILQNCDIFVLASIPLDSGDADGLPTVLIEALSCAKPTISTEVTGIPEIIVDGVTGLCVPPNDEIRLAEAILWMINNAEEARKMGMRGRDLVVESFNGENSARKLIECWKSAISQNSEPNHN